MKLQFLVLGFILVFSSFTYGGNIKSIDFSQQEEKTVKLAINDAVEFEPIKGLLILENIKDDGGVDMKLVLTDGRIWGLIPLKKLSSYNVDIDRDNDNDVAVLLREATSEIATISFKELRADIEQTNQADNNEVIDDAKTAINEEGGKVTGRVVSDNGGSRLVGVLIVIGIVAAGVLIYFFFVRKSKPY